MGESDPHSQSRECVSRCVLEAWALGLCVLLFLNPARALADLGDDLETQYQDLQTVTRANTEQITIRQDVLDKMSSHVSPASPDYRSLQNSIVDLKLKTNELFEKKSDLATQLKKIGRDPDRPNSKLGSSARTGTHTDHPTTSVAASDYTPLQKEDGGEVASADVTKLASDLIPNPAVVPIKPAVVFNPQTTPAPAADNTKSIASAVAPKPDPAVEAAIDEKVRLQKPDVDVLMKLASGLPEPPPVDVVAAAPVPAPVESPVPQAVQTPGRDWTSIVIGTVLVGGAIAGAVAAGSSGGGGGHGGGYGASSHGYTPCH